MYPFQFSLIITIFTYLQRSTFEDLLFLLSSLSKLLPGHLNLIIIDKDLKIAGKTQT